MEFTNLNDLFNYIKKDVQSSLLNDVAPMVKKIEQHAIEDVVYEAYNITGDGKKEPYYHVRRRTHGGLQDAMNMIENAYINGNQVVFTMRNMAMSADGAHESQLYIAELVEYGQGTGHGEYSWRENRDGTSFQYKAPRPFTSETMRRLDESGLHFTELVKALKARGYEIR